MANQKMGMGDHSAGRQLLDDLDQDGIDSVNFRRDHRCWVHVGENPSDYATTLDVRHPHLEAALSRPSGDYSRKRHRVYLEVARNQKTVYQGASSRQFDHSLPQSVMWPCLIRPD
jgi:hypothetical protein